ncbi:GAF domain-containing protein [Pyxidicoccus sp. MSG2]|uniref:GAF domain-containing protein n=1 Tax=Pyxidicoccus sp. MSG2 TaxID=2996790 RepID=UPI002270BBC1|nr:GAF domain-containing protein [Pyxidicoccus sp. MSG2]MCY1017270.1 GAF domain-containing protein [Pyxidicoccus sp. MSG2]
MSRRPPSSSRPASVAEPPTPVTADGGGVPPPEGSGAPVPVSSGNVLVREGSEALVSGGGEGVLSRETSEASVPTGGGAVRPREGAGTSVRLDGRGDAEERIAFLATAGELLSSSLEWRTVLRRLAELAVPVLADWCVVDVLTDDGQVERVAAMHREPEQVALVHELWRLRPPDLSTPGAVSEVLRTGEPVFLPEVTDVMLPGMMRVPEQLEVAKQLGIRSGIIIPLRARGRTLGAVALIRSDEGGSFQEAELELTLELARRASLSMDNALLYAEAREAQVRTERLQAVTAALSRAVSGEEVAEVVMREGLGTSGAVRGAVLEVREDDGITVRGSFGYTPELIEYFRSRKVSEETLLRRARERREAHWFTHLEPMFSESDPARDTVVALGEGARALLPLLVERGTRGFLVLAWDAPRAFVPAERAFLEALAYQCAQALERATLYETLRERGERLHHALEMGKEAEERLFFLLDASRALAEHLDDVEWTLEHVARAAARGVATFCLVELAGPDGALRCVAAAHRDATRDAFVLSTLSPTLSDGTLHLARDCFRVGETRYLPEVGEDLRERMCEGPEHRALLEVLDPHSLLSAPVRTRGRTLGVVTLGTAPPQRRLGTSDVTMAEELARRVAVALENASLYRDAQAAVRLRDEFLSVASHELKTPLTSLKLQHGLIGRALGAESHEKVGPRLSTAMRQVHRLTALVDSLLDVSRISLGRLALEPAEVDLGQAVRDAVDRMEEVFAQAGCSVRVEVSGPLPGRWDSLRLDQVLVNLLTNAAKYGAGRPVVVEAAPEGAGEVRLSVRDEGIGIAAEDLARVFGRFERAVSERHYGGLGLGLYISRQIVDAMGGRIEVESRPGSGSIFTVRLPRGLDAGR